MNPFEISPPRNLSAGPSLAVPWTSAYVNAQNLDSIGIIIITNGVTTNTGQFIVEGNNDINASLGWKPLDVDPPMLLFNDDAGMDINLNGYPYAFFRVSFVPGGPTPNGNVTIFVMGKGGGL